MWNKEFLGNYAPIGCGAEWEIDAHECTLSLVFPSCILPLLLGIFVMCDLFYIVHSLQLLSIFKNTL